MSDLIVQVVGLPAPQGSKRHVGNGVLVESSKRVKPWREAVKHAALDVAASAVCAESGYVYESGPVAVTATFWLPRPKGHYRTGRNAHFIRAGAPLHPATRPDIDKLLRSSLDALGEARVWRDDSQVVTVIALKKYGAPGAEFTIARLDGSP